MEIISTPIQEIHDALFAFHKVRVFIKREDLCHPVISGNKWHKLRLNLQAAKAQGYQQVLSFGGAYSNYIHALAFACQQQGLKAIGVIRGEELAQAPLNPCLGDAQSWGMELHFVSRSAYREKTQQTFLDELTNKWGDFYLIPEGGANSLAVTSCAEFAKTCFQQTAQGFDFVVLSCGTGCTLAGFIAGLNEITNDKKIMVQGFLAVHDKENIQNNISAWLSGDSTRQQALSEGKVAWTLNDAYVFGAYAKQQQELNDFMKAFQQQQGILLDPVYTGKMMFGIYDQIRQGKYPQDSRILVLHSGGLQGSRSGNKSP